MSIPLLSRHSSETRSYVRFVPSIFYCHYWCWCCFSSHKLPISSTYFATCRMLAHLIDTTSVQLQWTAGIPTSKFKRNVKNLALYDKVTLRNDKLLLLSEVLIDYSTSLGLIWELSFIMCSIKQLCSAPIRYHPTQNRNVSISNCNIGLLLIWITVIMPLIRHVYRNVYRSSQIKDYVCCLVCVVHPQPCTNLRWHRHAYIALPATCMGKSFKRNNGWQTKTAFGR